MDLVLAGRYELEVPLGRGGSSEVWRGGDMATQRPVAIRLAHLTAVDDTGTLAESVARFLREATALSGLRNPSIVAAVDAGRIATRLFVVTELAPGAALADLMEERGARGTGLFPLATVLHLARQACTGLAAAHDAGVVHRDIKPGNLMVTPQGDVKIIDFGVARLLADNGARLARPPQSVNSIAFMSPELAQGLEVDGRSDLYSVGCLLYQLLSGRPPFFSSLPSALLMMQVMDRPAPLASLRPDLPAELCRLVGELMDKEPAARPATAAQVVSRIEAIERSVIGAEPEQEAARRTIEADLRGLAVGGSSVSGGHAVLAPDRRFALADTVGMPSRQPADPRPTPLPVPAQPGPAMRSAPQGAASPSTSGPALPSPRPRPVWRSVIAILAVAVLAAAGVYFWNKQHQALKITNVGVRIAKQASGCTGTDTLVGTITTNGRSGVVRYEWVAGDTVLLSSSATSAPGSDTVRVPLSWPFHFKGKGSDVVQLRVLSPQQERSGIIFPYSCPA